MNMTQTILSSITIFLATAFSLSLLRRKDISFASIVLFFAMTAIVVLELFDLLAVLYPEDLIFWKKFSISAEGCIAPSWLLFSLTYAREHNARSLSISQRLLVLLSFIFPITALSSPFTTFFYSPDFSTEHVLFLGKIGFIFYVGILIFLVISLFNLEVTLANASHSSRWKIKFEILGAVSLLAVLIFYYSQGLLYRTINMNLVPLRSLITIVGIALMAYSRFRRGNSVKIQVSKQMAFKSVVLLAVGVYLIGLGLIGEGMKYFGDSFQRSMAIALAFLAGIAMVILLLSETVKRKIKVFLYENFYQHKYDYRVQWLQFTDRLSSSKTGDDLLKSIVCGFSEVFGMGCGALFLYDSDRQVYFNAASLGLEHDDVMFKPRDPFIIFMLARKSLVNMYENESKREVEQNEFFTRNAVSFIIPLLHNDSLEGFIALGRPVDKGEMYNYEDCDLMNTLSRQATSAILNLRLSDELSRAKEMEAIGKLSAFILHDLKNLVTTLALVVDNAKHYIDNPEFQVDMLESLDGTVVKMNSLILRLKKLQDKGCLHREPADLMEIAAGAARQVGTAEVRVSGAAVFSEVDVEEIHKLLLNLILNALDATVGKGEVSVEVGFDDMAYIRVRDEGYGMSEDFLLKHLFKPFNTTKEKGLGIGLYQCKQIAESHGGRIEVTSEVGRGSTFTVWLPTNGESIEAGNLKNGEASASHA
jgi:putative PEP-CTERM system histidine kinase